MMQPSPQSLTRSEKMVLLSISLIYFIFLMETIYYCAAAKLDLGEQTEEETDEF